MIELLIVLGILAILLTTGFTAYTASQRNARDAKRKTDLETIRQALELYKSDKGGYPPPEPPVPPYIGWCTVLWGCWNQPTWYNDVAGALVNGGYLSRLPKDSKYANTDQDYFYRRTATGYELYAQLENNENNMYQTTGGAMGNCACGVSGTNSYDYQVTNP